MQNQDYNIILAVDQTPQEAFQAINDVRAWWSEDFKGQSEHLNEEFEVRFGDVHFSRQKLIEVVPNEKVTWLVTESYLSFLKDKEEWTGTRIRFEIARDGAKTQVRFTHQGLVPGIECYGDCSNGWNQFLKQSLWNLITTGQGQPNILEPEVAAKSLL